MMPGDPIGASISPCLGGEIGQPLPVSRAEWVAWLLTLEGTPYRHQGRLPDVGLDCVGPLILAARHFGLQAHDFDVTGYTPQPDGSLQPILEAHLTPTPRDQLALGDVVLNGFRLEPPRHIAIIVGQAYGEWVMLHANGITGKVQRERLPYGRRYYRYVQGYSVRGVGP